jgi:hypothetical protein
MTDISQWGIQAWGNFVLEKQNAKLMYYYLFQIWKYLCTLIIDINLYPTKAPNPFKSASYKHTKSSAI